MPIKLLPMRKVLERSGKGKSSHYADIQKGIFVPPVEVGPRAKRYPEHEVEALNAARIANYSDDQIRQLVVRLIAARKQIFVEQGDASTPSHGAT